MPHGKSFGQTQSMFAPKPTTETNAFEAAIKQQAEDAKQCWRERFKTEREVIYHAPIKGFAPGNR